MNYTKPLPESSQLRDLSEAIGTFPIRAGRLAAIARAEGFGSPTVELLNLFRGEFESRADLYARTSELVVLIKEEQTQPEEKVLSPQD